MSSFPLPLLTATQPPSPVPSGHHHTVVCVLWLIPSPSSIQSLLLPSDNLEAKK